MREAPSRVIIERLLALGAKIQAYDPEAMKAARKIFGDKIRYAKNNYEALKGADALILVTEWNEFRNPDFKKMKDLLKAPVIFDGRNQYSRREMRELGFVYFGLEGWHTRTPKNFTNGLNGQERYPKNQKPPGRSRLLVSA